MTPTPTDSRDELEKLERKHAENPEGRYFVPLANAYRRAGELSRATALLREGLEQHPDYLSAHIVLGRCFVDQGDADAAGDEFRYVLSLDSQNLIALRTLGEIARDRGRADEARKWYRDLLAVDPMNEDAREALATLGDGPDASAAVRPLLDAEGPAHPASDEAAHAVPPADDYQALFGTMIDLDSTLRGDEPAFADENDVVVTETIAELYTRQGFYDRAADVYRELIRRRGGDPSLEERLQQVERLASSPREAERASQMQSPAPEEVVSDADAAAIFVGATEGLDVYSPDVSMSGSDSLSDEGGSDEGVPSSDAEPTGVWLDEDPFASSFVTGFPSEDQAFAGRPFSPADAGEAGDGSARAVEERSDTIRDFLGQLLAWIPASSHSVPPGRPQGDFGIVPSSPVDATAPAEEEFLFGSELELDDGELDSAFGPDGQRIDTDFSASRVDGAGGFAGAASELDLDTGEFDRDQGDALLGSPMGLERGDESDVYFGAPIGFEPDRSIEAPESDPDHLPLLREDDPVWFEGPETAKEEDAAGSSALDVDAPAAGSDWPENEERLPLASDLIDDELLFPWEVAVPASPASGPPSPIELEGSLPEGAPSAGASAEGARAHGEQVVPDATGSVESLSGIPGVAPDGSDEVGLETGTRPAAAEGDEGAARGIDAGAVTQDTNEAVEPASVTGTAPAPTGPSSPGSAAPSPESTPSRAAAADEDDDLASFQAWLRSLKR